MKIIPVLLLSVFFVTLSYANQLDSLQQILNNTSDAKARIQVLVELMQETTSHENTDMYFNYAQQLLEEATQQRDTTALAKRKESLSIHYYFNNTLDSSVVLMRDAAILFESQNYLEKALDCKRKLGTFYARLGKFEKSENIMKGIIQKAYPDSLKKQLAQAYNALGNTFGRQNKMDSAMAYFIKSEKTFRAINDTIEMLRPINGRTSILGHQKKYDEALVLLHQVKDIRKKLNLKSDLLKSYSYIASTYEAKADFENALYYAKQAFNLSDELNDNSIKVNILNTISGIYLHNEDYENSLNYCNQAIEVNNATNTGTLATSLALKGNVLNRMERWEEAIVIIQVALEELSIEGDYPELRLLLAEAYLRKGDIKSAKQLVNLLEQQKENLSLPIYRDHYYQLMAEIKYEDKKYNQALKYGQLCLDSDAQSSAFFENSRLAKLMADSHERLGNYKQALNYQRLFKTYSDSLNNKDKIRRIAQQTKDFEFELEKKTIEAAQLKKETMLKAETRQTRTIAAGIGILAILGFGFFWNARRKNKLILSQNQKLEQLNTTKDQLFAIISHDLRKPALAFRGISQKVRFLLKKQEFDTLNKYGSSLEMAANSLNGLLDNLLKWALQQRDMLPYQPISINLAEVTEEIMELFEQIAADKNIVLKTNIPEITTAFVDPNAYATIIRNLIDNAIKFTPEGGTIELEVSEQASNVFLKVKDSGVGITKEKITKIFDLQKHKSTQGTAGEHGTGLGLSVVKDLVLLNKGSINVQSQSQKGTTFELVFPVV